MRAAGRRRLGAGDALSSRDAFARFKAEWIDPGVSDCEGYVARVKEVIGEGAWQALHVTRHILPKAPRWTTAIRK